MQAALIPHSRVPRTRVAGKRRRKAVWPIAFQHAQQALRQQAPQNAALGQRPPRGGGRRLGGGGAAQVAGGQQAGGLSKVAAAVGQKEEVDAGSVEGR